jgi:hypothetical protein
MLEKHVCDICEEGFQSRGELEKHRADDHGEPVGQRAAEDAIQELNPMGPPIGAPAKGENASTRQPGR